MFKIINSRENTIALLDLIEEGILDPINVLQASLNWHSDHEVGEMARANEFLFEKNEEDCDEEY